MKVRQTFNGPSSLASRPSRLRPPPADSLPCRPLPAAAESAQTEQAAGQPEDPSPGQAHAEDTLGEGARARLRLGDAAAAGRRRPGHLLRGTAGVTSGAHRDLHGSPSAAFVASNLSMQEYIVTLHSSNGEPEWSFTEVGCMF